MLKGETHSTSLIDSQREKIFIPFDSRLLQHGFPPENCDFTSNFTSFQKDEGVTLSLLTILCDERQGPLEESEEGKLLDNDFLDLHRPRKQK